ncbi:MAG: tyrosine-type recombinase/integrase [Opitutaceae bacterium]
MASVRRRPHTKYFTACYTDVNGQQRQCATKECSRATALAIAIKLESAYRKKMTEAQARKILSEIYEEVRGETLFHSTLSEFLTSWLRNKKVEMSSGGYKRYKNSVDKLIAYLGTKANEDIAYVTKGDIQAFRDEVAEKHSAATSNTELKILHIAFQQAVGDGLRLDNPTAGIKKFRVTSANNRRPFTFEEIQRLLATLGPKDEWRGIILFGVFTGQRLGDIASLRWKDIQYGDLSDETNKTKRFVDVPLKEDIEEYLGRLTPGRPQDPIFPVSAQARIDADGESRRLSNQFYDLLVRVGLAEKRSKGPTGRGHSTSRKVNELSFHCLRHTTTSWLKRAGVSDSVTMDIVGHETVAASRTYTKIDGATKREAINRLPTLRVVESIQPNQ